MIIFRINSVSEEDQSETVITTSDEEDGKSVLIEKEEQCTELPTPSSSITCAPKGTKW